MLEGIGRFAHARHGFCVVSLCQGKESDQDFFAFVAIEPHNYRYFRKNYERGIAPDFTVFGRELLRGTGTSPSLEVIEYIRNKYGIEFNVDKRFIERLVALVSHTEQNSANGSPFPPSPLGKPAEALGTN